MVTVERIAIGIGAVLSVLLQVLLAPHVSIGFATPNFMATLCVAIAVARADSFGPVLPFALGLVYDLLSGGPVGAMAFSLTAITMLSAWMFRRADNDTLFMAIAVLALGMLLVEVVYGMFFLLFGYAVGLFEAFAYRIVPGFVYDLVIAVISYLLIARFLRRDVPYASEIRQLQ